MGGAQDREQIPGVAPVGSSHSHNAYEYEDSKYTMQEIKEW